MSFLYGFPRSLSLKEARGTECNWLFISTMEGPGERFNVVFALSCYGACKWVCVWRPGGSGGGGRSRFFNNLCKDDGALFSRCLHDIHWQSVFVHLMFTSVPWRYREHPTQLPRRSSQIYLFTEGRRFGNCNTKTTLLSRLTLQYLCMTETKHGCQLEVICPAAGTWSSVSDSEWRMLWRSPPSCSLLDTWFLEMVKNDD